MGKCEKFVVRCIGKEKAQLTLKLPARSPSVTIVLSSDDEDFANVDEKRKKDAAENATRELKPHKSRCSEAAHVTNTKILSVLDKVNQRRKSKDHRISLEGSHSWNETNKNSSKEEELKEKHNIKKLKKREKKKLVALKKEELNFKDKTIERERIKPRSWRDDPLGFTESLNSKKNEECSQQRVKGDTKKKPSSSKSLYSEEKQNDSRNSDNQSLKTPYIKVPLIIKEEVSDDFNIFTRRPKKQPIEIEKTKVLPEIDDAHHMETYESPKSEPDTFKQLNYLLLNEVGVNMNEFLDIMRTENFELKKEVSKMLPSLDEIPPAPGFKNKVFEGSPLLTSQFRKADIEHQPLPPATKERDLGVSQEINFNLNLSMPPTDPSNRHTLNLKISTSNGMQMESTHPHDDNLPSMSTKTSPPMQMSKKTSPPMQMSEKTSPPMSQKCGNPSVFQNVPNLPTFHQNLFPETQAIPYLPTVRDPRLRRVQSTTERSLPVICNSPDMKHREFSSGDGITNFPIQSKAATDPRLRHAQLNTFSRSSSITDNLPIMYCQEYSRDGVMKRSDNFTKQIKAATDKKEALTYGEYKKRKALEEQQKKDFQLKKLLNEVEYKNADAVRQLNERRPLLEEKTMSRVLGTNVNFISEKFNKKSADVNASERFTPISKPVVEKTLSEPVIEYVRKVSEENSNDGSYEVEDSDMDEITKINTLRNRRLEVKPLKDTYKEELKKENSTSQKITVDKDVSRKDEETEKLLKTYKPKNYREVIRLNLDIMESFMTNDVLQDEYGLRRSRNDLSIDVPAFSRRIMTRRRTCLAACKNDPDRSERIQKRRTTSYVEKKEAKENLPQPIKNKEITNSNGKNDKKSSYIAKKGDTTEILQLADKIKNEKVIMSKNRKEKRNSHEKSKVDRPTSPIINSGIRKRGKS